MGFRALLHLRIALPILLALAGCGSDAGTANLSLELESAGFLASSTTLSFRLLDQDSGAAPVLQDQLTVVHEQSLHVYVFDEALQEFRHEHPSFDGSQWVLPISLSTNGNYRIYAQGRLTSGQLDFTAGSSFVVTGGSAANPTPPSLSSSLTATDGTSRITLGSGPYSAGGSSKIPVSFSRTDSSSVSLGLYLGEYIHAVFVPESGTPLTHVHGMLEGGAFHLRVSFPSAGMYRGWIQFKDGGVLKTTAVAVQVQ